MASVDIKAGSTRAARRNGLSPPDISVVIVSFNDSQDTTACVAALQASRGASFEIIVVDNASGAEHAARLGELTGVDLVVEGHNLGFGAACNRGFARAEGRYVLFMNADVTVQSSTTLAELVAIADATRRLGALGCRMTNTDGTAQVSAYRRLPGLFEHAWEYTPMLSSLAGFLGVSYSPVEYSRERLANDRRCVAHLLGAFFLVPSDVFAEVGGFDEGFFLYREETDLFERLAALGRDIVYTPVPIVAHASGSSTQNRYFANLDPRFLVSVYRYFRLRHGVGYTAAAWLLAVAGLAVSMPYLRLLRARNRRRGLATDDIDFHLTRVRGGVEWHLANVSAVWKRQHRTLLKLG